MVILSALAAFFITRFSSGEKEPEYYNYIPHGAAGVMIVRRIPESLESLKATRLGEWIDLQDTENGAGPWKENYGEYLAFFRENVREMVLCLHSISQQESRTFKPELTMFLRARPGRAGPLAEALTSFVLSRFGGDSARRQNMDGITVIQGSEKGQVFYLEKSRDYLAAANSDKAWEQYREIKKMTEGKVLLPPWRSEMKEDPSAEIFLYFKGISGWIPGFIYSIRRTGKDLEDSYREF